MIENKYLGSKVSFNCIFFIGMNIPNLSTDFYFGLFFDQEYNQDSIVRWSEIPLNIT